MSEQDTAQSFLPTDEFRGKDGRKLRITKPVRTAIQLMVLEGLKRAEAAQKAGIREHTLYVAMTKPHVKKYQRALMDELRTSEGHRSYLKLTELRDLATSEHVQMESAKFVAGVSGISPVQKQEVTHSGQVQVGYVIDLSPQQQPMRDVTPKHEQLIDNQELDNE